MELFFVFPLFSFFVCAIIYTAFLPGWYFEILGKVDFFLAVKWWELTEEKKLIFFMR
jgi:hypothetical protein